MFFFEGRSIDDPAVSLSLAPRALCFPSLSPRAPASRDRHPRVQDAGGGRTRGQEGGRARAGATRRLRSRAGGRAVREAADSGALLTLSLPALPPTNAAVTPRPWGRGTTAGVLQEVPPSRAVPKTHLLLLAQLRSGRHGCVVLCWGWGEGVFRWYQIRANRIGRLNQRGGRQGGKVVREVWGVPFSLFVRQTRPHSLPPKPSSRKQKRRQIHTPLSPLINTFS